MKNEQTGVASRILVALVVVLVPQVGFGADNAGPSVEHVRGGNQGKTERIDTNRNKNVGPLGGDDFLAGIGRLPGSRYSGLIYLTIGFDQRGRVRRVDMEQHRN